MAAGFHGRSGSPNKRRPDERNKEFDLKSIGKQNGFAGMRYLRGTKHHDVPAAVILAGVIAASPAARKIALLPNVTIVEADMSNPPTLVKAFQGAEVVFAVTNFYDPRILENPL